MSIRSLSLLSLAVSALVVALPAAAELPWPDKNGPTLHGVVPPEHARGLPVVWDEESGKHIAWSVDIHGAGHSTPVIGNGRIWLTTATEDGAKQYVLCVDEKSGEILHDKLLFENANPEPLSNSVNTYASPSCVLEEDAVYVHFGSYGTARLDPRTAEVVWQRRDLPARHFRGPGSSPILVGELLVLTFDGVDQQYLTALNKETGKTVWRTDRSTDYGDLEPDGSIRGDGDFRKAYGTPGVVEVGGKPQIVSVGSRAAFGYDAATGEELWTIRHRDFNAAARVIFHGNLALVHTGSRGANLFGVRLTPQTRGDITETEHVVWNRTRGNAKLSSPVLYEGRVYFVTEKGVFYGLDAATGEELFVGRIGGNFISTPIVANGLVYLCDEHGRQTLAKAGESFEIVAKNRLGDGMRSSPAAAHGALFLRTFKRLYRIASD